MIIRRAVGADAPAIARITNAIIRESLPRQLSAADMAEAIDKAIAETGASGMRDMGKVMGALKGRYAGQMDFGKASAAVKAKLS